MPAMGADNISVGSDGRADTGRNSLFAQIWVYESPDKTLAIKFYAFVLKLTCGVGIAIHLQ
jgi:hypothetical protein